MSESEIIPLDQEPFVKRGEKKSKSYAGVHVVDDTPDGITFVIVAANAELLGKVMERYGMTLKIVPTPVLLSNPKDTLISELREAVGVLAEYAERGECSAICAQVCPACAKVAAMLANPTAKQAVEAARARSQK